MLKVTDFYICITLNFCNKFVQYFFTFLPSLNRSITEFDINCLSIHHFHLISLLEGDKDIKVLMFTWFLLTLLLSVQPKLHRVLAILSATGFSEGTGQGYP